MTICHPVLVLSAFQSDKDELRHRKRIQTAKNDWDPLLKAPLEKPQVEDGILDENLPAPTPNKFNLCVVKHMWAPNQSSKRHWGTNNTEELPKKSSVTTGLSTKLAEYSQTHSTERVLVPRLNENKSGFWSLLKLHTELATRLHPVHNPRQNLWVHPLQQDWLQTENQPWKWVTNT